MTLSWVLENEQEFEKQEGGERIHQEEKNKVQGYQQGTFHRVTALTALRQFKSSSVNEVPGHLLCAINKSTFSESAAK
jgi:hypothetical protein